MKVVWCLLFLMTSPLLVSATVSASLAAFHHPSGLVDDCCCSVDEIVSVNNDHISAALDNLVKRKFFKYFRVNLEQDCPFWVVSKTCGLSGGCSVCECDEHEVPKNWMSETSSQVNRAVGKDFNPWIDEPRGMWFKPGNEADMIYVDLTKNPEVNTGYVGPEANRVWMAIYKENCFEGNSQCMEHRVFYRLISGFHSAITAHIFRNFHKTPNGWEPNLEGFIKTLGAFPDRMKNLYFTYLFLLRAVEKAAPVLQNYDFSTGNDVEDKATKTMVQDLLSLKEIGPCSKAFGGFNETSLFPTDKMNLKIELQEKFRNVSSILNCIACESCRLLARVKILGIGTALKILFEGNSENKGEIVHLERNEVVALVNTLQQMSHALRIVSEMEELKQKQIARENPSSSSSSSSSSPSSIPYPQSSYLLLGSVLGGGVVFVVFLFLLSRIRSKSVKTRNEATSPVSPASLLEAQQRSKSD